MIVYYKKGECRSGEYLGTLRDLKGREYILMQLDKPEGRAGELIREVELDVLAGTNKIPKGMVGFLAPVQFAFSVQDFRGVKKVYLFPNKHFSNNRVYYTVLVATGNNLLDVTGDVCFITKRECAHYGAINLLQLSSRMATFFSAFAGETIHVEVIKRNLKRLNLQWS